MAKKLICCVRPGVLLTRARPWRPARELSSDDLPTLERPANAISGRRCRGNWLGSVDPAMNCAVVTRMRDLGIEGSKDREYEGPPLPIHSNPRSLDPLIPRSLLLRAQHRGGRH